MSSPSNITGAQQAPFSQEAEEAVLGAVLINPDAFLSVASFLKAADFFIRRHEYIWESFMRISERGERIDLLTLQEELRALNRLTEIGGPGYLLQLINNTPTAIHAEIYGRLVERAAVRRRLLTAADEIRSLAMQEELSIEQVTNQAETRLFRVTEGSGRKDIVPIREAISDYFDRVEHRMQHPNEPMGLPTGFRDLDEMMGGLQKSDLLIFAGRPGMGKTSFLLSVALNAAKVGGRIAIFTMEMGSDQIVQRLISMETQINTQRLRIGHLNHDEWNRFVEASGRLASLKVFIDDSAGMTPLQMRTKCRRLMHEFGLDLVIVDYMQLMTAGSGYENNRVQEISYISRNMKELARELNVPVYCAAQLSRAVESRQDKRPQLSDLRESGCLTGDTLIYQPDHGRLVPIRDVIGQRGFRVLSLNADTWKLEAAEVTNAFSTGIKPVYRLTTALGRTIRATGNHKFLTIRGWKRLDELTETDRIALPRTLHAPTDATMSESEAALLGHLIGDGCTLPRHAIQYTTRELDLAEIVVGLASEIFGDRITPRIVREKDQNWYQVFLSSTERLTHGKCNPVRDWLTELGIFGLRSYEKHLPETLFSQPTQIVTRFLKHLWATDGCVALRRTSHGYYPAVFYATSSPRLAFDVQTLLLRLSINARVKRVAQNGKGRDQYHVIVTGNEDLRIFAETIAAVGSRRSEKIAEVRHYVESHVSNTNRDIIPHDIWRMYAVPSLKTVQLTSREFQAQLGNAYCGTGLYKQNVSRERASRMAEITRSETLQALATSDVYWDSIQSIVPDGEEEVFDLTVPAHSNFVAQNIIVHNSIEQDADIVMFLYRDAVYNEATEFPNRADVIVAKHRNGPTGTISLHFERSLTKFTDARTHTIDVSSL